MPVDFEPLYSASPPLFKHFGHAFAEYRYATNLGGGLGARLAGRAAFLEPLRPCLIVRADVDECYAGEEAATSPPPTSGSPTKNKKKVVFADDRGLALTHVKVMSEPSDCPPRWQDDFMERVTRGATAACVAVDRWEAQFAQPASDYVEFRRKLDAQCVCLENVITKETEESVCGTVKVKNLSFSKEVRVRVTYDGWVTHVDHRATYVPSGLEGTSVYDLYDTFSFAFVVAPDAAAKSGQVEFCVCYSCEGVEYWDNNGGRNYRLRAAVRPTEAAAATPPLPRFEDAFTARLDSWTEFASWNHLINDAPYW